MSRMPNWLLWVGAFLLAITGILASLDKIQDFFCRHGLTVICSSEFSLVLGPWLLDDTAGGWKAYISNPTPYAGSISDARLVFKRSKPNLPVAMTLSPAPADWHASVKCGEPDPGGCPDHC